MEVEWGEENRENRAFAWDFGKSLDFCGGRAQLASVVV